MDGDQCTKYKKMKKVGRILTISGVATLFLGIILIDTESNNDSLLVYPLFGDISDYAIVGITCAWFGLAGIASGIPVTIIANKNSKQYCNPKTNSLSLITTSKGLGLQLSF